MTNDELEFVANRCRMQLMAMGIDLKVVRDINETRDLYERLGKDLSPAADPNRLLLTQGNCFAIFGLVDGDPIFGFVVRVDDLGDEDAQSFIPRSVETIFGVKITGQSCDVYRGQKWGRVGYFGDLKSLHHKGLKTRGGMALRLASTYAHFRAFTDLNTQMHYCFLRISDYRNGIPYGFLETGPYIWESDKDLYADGSPAWIGQLSVSKMPELAASMYQLLPDLLHEDQKPFFKVVGKEVVGKSAS